MDAINKRCFDLVAALREKYPRTKIAVDFNPPDTNWIDIGAHTIAVREDNYSLIRGHLRFKTSSDLQTAEEVLTALEEVM